MITREQVKNDLKDIKYYHTHRASLEKAVSNMGEHSIKALAEKYGELAKKAGVAMFDMYNQLYVEGHTHDQVTVTLDCCYDYINRSIRKLLDFFMKELNK